MTSRTILRSLFFGSFVIAGACKDSGPKGIGAPSQLVLVSGGLGAPANTAVTTPIVVSVRDSHGQGVPDQTVNFSLTAGGGSLIGTTVATSDAQGNVTGPGWKLGKSASPQTMRATLGTITLDIAATIQTNYTILLHFFGPSMSAAEQAVFTAAAQRIMGIVTGDLPNVNMAGAALDQCTTPGAAPMNETVDDLVVYASVQFIDGAGSGGSNILGSAGPCYIRDVGQPTVVVGSMIFDSFDIDQYIASGQATEIITHEMLHTLGVGFWKPPAFVLQLKDSGTADPRYTGAEGRLGCVAVGGTVTCATDVPVEGTPSPVGTRDSHWRESTFGNELMTGFYNNGPNPLSLLTIRSLSDLGYTVNAADFDTYTIPGGLLRVGVPSTSIPLANWERLNTVVYYVDPNGRITAVRKRQ